MIIDDQTFTDFAIHLRRASDGLLGAARQMADLCDPENEPPGERQELMSVLDSLVGMNEEFVLLEGILRTVWDSNRDEQRRVC